MAVTLTGAIKAALAGPFPSLPVWRDRAEEDAATFPRVTVLEQVSTVLLNHGDQGAPNAALAVDEEVQLDLWQLYRDPTTNAVVEDYTLAERIAKALTGTPMAVTGRHVYRCRAATWVRFLDPEPNLVHTVIRLNVSHSI